ncbi:hypothetical protein U1Q18_035960, partial [Sarracenia purpurea var. burkii]
AQSQQDQEDSRKSDPHPPPLAFPGSVSPYICRQKSDNSSGNHHRRRRRLKDLQFFSTPQIGPTYGDDSGGGGGGTGNSYKKKKSRFSLFTRLFRPKSKMTESDHCASGPNSRNPCTAASSSSPSWFSTMLSSGHQRHPSRLFSRDESTTGIGRRTCRTGDRGMSPARTSNYGDDADCFDGLSGYSSESSQSRWQTPMRASGPLGRHGGGRPSHSHAKSGMKFCFSPLVRTSPIWHWNQKGMPPEVAFSGEIRVPTANPHLSTAATFCGNRSRKLADFGRFNHNH